VFAYEIPSNNNIPVKKIQTPAISLNNNSVLIYNFHSIFTQQRFFIFVLNLPNQSVSTFGLNFDSIFSIAELFPNAN
jgi:hypothetical protein